MQGNDPLATLLFQIASPAHIPWGDTRWQELLHGYAVWVHVTVDVHDDIDDHIHDHNHVHDENQNHNIVQQACASMAKHAATSSNLATLTMHVTRMLNELVKDLQSEATTTTTPNSQHYQGFSQRISLVAKARATAGALQLLRLFVHFVICRASKDPTTTNALLEDAFTYSTRGDLPRDQRVGMPLVHALMDLIVSTTTTLDDQNNSQPWTTVPEIYDALVLDFELLLVLCGTQLYQPFVSSFQMSSSTHTTVTAGSSHYYMDELFRSQNNNNNHHQQQHASEGEHHFSGSSRSLNHNHVGSSPPRSLNNNAEAPTTCWTPQRILQACLEWQVRRPPAPPRSIAEYYATLIQSVVTSQGETLGPDGMYESHLVVQAAAPVEKERDHNHDPLLKGNDSSSSHLSHVHSTSTSSSKSKMIMDATKGVLVLSSTIILLPFRLMSLVWGVWGHHHNHSKQHQQAALAKKFAQTQRTKDVLWVSDSPLAELSSCLVLLLVNNHRNEETTTTRMRINPFRTQLFALSDNRWDQQQQQQQGDNGTGSPLNGLPDLPLDFNASTNSLAYSMTLEGLEDDELRQSLLSDDFMLQVGGANNNHTGILQLNFESLFLSFGRTLHTELGALLLYTMIQSSPSFAESLAVRSDLDTLVLPLLRTLYFSSASKTYMAQDYASKLSQRSSNNESTTQALNVNVRNCPFRSQSQLYVIIILLLLFSQDSSFGNDAFRRITVSNVLWYKERTLKNINLGSVLLLTLLRSLLFNLHRLQDSFLLSNCCAVLMNLSPAIVDLHEYAAMRLVSVTVSVMKRHSKLRAALGKDAQVDEDDLSTPLGMYAEVSRTLLGLVKHGMSTRNLERNLHLVYSLVYHQSDLQKLFKEGLYTKSEMERIQSVTLAASAILSEEGARSATKALKVLETRVKEIVQAADKKRRNEHEDFTFTYEEEQDPEIFFVPYVWEVIVCAVTSSSIEWDKSKIQGFALLEEEDRGPEMEDLDHVPAPQGTYAKDVQDVV